MKVTVVVGNPKLASKTLAAAQLVAARLTGRQADDIIELAALGPALLEWGNAEVAAAKKIVLGSGLVIFASPTYKATYTGLLKLFLDQFGAGELVRTIGVPLMLGAAPHHALAPELSLRPVLVEIGCSCPLPGLYLLDTEFDSGPVLDAWCERARIAAPGLMAS